MASHAVASDSPALHAPSSKSDPQPAQPDISIALLDAMEKDAFAVAQSLAKVSAGLRSSLSEVSQYECVSTRILEFLRDRQPMILTCLNSSSLLGTSCAIRE